MKMPLWKSLLVCVWLSAALSTFATEEQDLIAVLQSGASAAEKSVACARLRIVGSNASVPSIAALLTEPATSQAARYALEGMNYPEATGALREALPRSSPAIKAALADSLGWKRDEASVPVLVPLLEESQSGVAAAAARALGRISNTAAVAALRSVSASTTADLRVAVQEALLACADSFVQRGDAQSAASIFADLYSAGATPIIRIAAWRGRVLASNHRATLVLPALQGQDRALKETAEKLLSELSDPILVEACLSEWQELAADAQLAVLRAGIKSGDNVQSSILQATGSAYESVRVAAWEALGDFAVPNAVPDLAKAAVAGGFSEKNAARETLARMPGDKVRESIERAVLDSRDIHVRTELVRALGSRGETQAAGVLLQYASGAEPEELRFAALESLRQVADPDTFTPLLALLAKAQSESDAEPVLKALEAVSHATRDKEQITGVTLAALKSGGVAERQRILALLPELGTPAALTAAQAATQDANLEIAKDAIRALARWPNSGPAEHLIEMGRNNTNSTLQVLALRAGIEVTAQETDPVRHVKLLREALQAANRPGEKKLALAQAGTMSTSDALELVNRFLSDATVADEAGLAALSISERSASTDPAKARETARKVLAHAKQPDILSRAWKLQGKPSPGPFIRDWQVAGPYTKAGANGALALFDIPFAPEKKGENVQWKSVPQTDGVNLAALFPGRESCAAYLRTRVIAPESMSAVLLVGSDDGVKAWVNGEVVHANNVDRGDVPDQDAAIVELRKGANELLLKITQGGAGWSSHARLIGLNGEPVPGLRCASNEPNN